MNDPNSKTCDGKCGQCIVYYECAEVEMDDYRRDPNDDLAVNKTIAEMTGCSLDGEIGAGK